MDTIIKENRVEFKAGERIAGVYRLDDPFKPHFSLLNTPAGHNTVCVSPGDHRHHKGLMYALRCEDVNFWEENPGKGECGIQEIVATKSIDGGIRQELLWHGEKGDLQTYREIRTITCRSRARAFEWTWITRRESLRDHLLIKSEWSMELPDGRKLNYHGLGIRFPWMWSFGDSQFGTVKLDGKPVDPMVAAGSQAQSVGFTGLVDGQWERTEAAVTLTQDKDYGWFVLRHPFPYLSVGPSTLKEVPVGKGQVFTECYRIMVEDLSGDASPASSKC